MKILSLENELKENAYPGRGIVTGLSADSKYAIALYFIMGRSENSRNRIFVPDGDGIRTQAFDPSKMKDPSLIIYAPVRVLKNADGMDTIVTNGDQTDTAFEGLKKGLTFEQSLRSRTFEPDSPNFTPRISSALHLQNGKFSYEISILKSDMGDSSSSNRYTFSYENPKSGVGRFIHTYVSDGNPLPSFEGEPAPVDLSAFDSIDSLANAAWSNLNEQNKVSLFVRFINIKTLEWETRIINKNK